MNRHGLLTCVLEALAKADELPMPKPDKTKIDKWNLTQFSITLQQVKDIHSLTELPKTVKSLIDLEDENQNLICSTQ